jgi:hypothetical protein
MFGKSRDTFYAINEYTSKWILKFGKSARILEFWQFSRFLKIPLICGLKWNENGLAAGWS